MVNSISRYHKVIMRTCQFAFLIVLYPVLCDKTNAQVSQDVIVRKVVVVKEKGTGGIKAELKVLDTADITTHFAYTDANGIAEPKKKCNKQHRLVAKPDIILYEARDDPPYCAAEVTIRMYLSFPLSPMRLIVPFAPGGSADIIGRVIAQKLSDVLEQPVVVDNRVGANGILGTELAAKATPDGYTLLLGGFTTHTVNVSLYRKIPYDPIRDFIPVSMIAIVPNVLIAHPSLPVNSVQELIELGKSRPGALNYASAGVGSEPHLAGELFKNLVKLEMVHVPFKSAGTATLSVVAGQSPLMFITLPSALPHIRAGRIKALGISTNQRSQIAPEIPTIGESVRGYEAGTWFGVLAPAGTPRVIISGLNSAIVNAVRSPDVKDQLVGLGAEPIGNTQEQFVSYIKTEGEKWGRVIRGAGITVQ